MGFNPNDSKSFFNHLGLSQFFTPSMYKEPNALHPEPVLI